MPDPTPPPPRLAPNGPGIEPRWTSSAKSAVGTAFGEGSRVWFTASHGILNEAYYPEVDVACMRDAGFLVSANGFFSEEKRDCLHEVGWLAPGVPAFRFYNRCVDGRYVIVKRVCTSAEFDAILQHVSFRVAPGHGAVEDYRLTFVVASHLGNRGGGNTAWVATSKGDTVLVAERDGYAMAVACDAGWRATSVGFVGVNDGWRDVKVNGRLTTTYDRAEKGNVALAGEVDMRAGDGQFSVAIGFGPDPQTAILQARAVLSEPYERVERRYAAPWLAWQADLRRLDEPPNPGGAAPLYRTSTAVLHTHFTMNVDGGAIASLSVPWGFAKGDDDLGGYHLVWPRDMAETGGALLAAGAFDSVRAMLRYLALTQEADGHWPQNMWINGAAYWNGIQLDETALPVLLVDLARREECIGPEEEQRWWPMVRKAALYLAAHGPATEQDRWEEDPGYTPFTLSATIAALLVAGDLARRVGDDVLARHFEDTADVWFERIDSWIYVTGSAIGHRVGADGYYIRLGHADVAEAASPTAGFVPIKNRPAEHSQIAAHALVSPDALALVRFGLRRADDPRIQNTVRVIDALLRTDTATGPTWHRYNEDGYGEHDDGAPFDGIGRGRGWPLLAGERAHFELAAGHTSAAAYLAMVMRQQASDGGMLPEQVWDAADIPGRELFNGRPAGSAMPLVWAHAEYVKLMRSLEDGRVFDTPTQTVERYLTHTHVPRIALWRFRLRRRVIPPGRPLRIDLGAAARVRWTVDGWTHSHDSDTRPIADGHHTVELPVGDQPAGTTVNFTFFWTASNRWEGTNFDVRIDGVPGGTAASAPGTPTPT